jgi:signal peptidase II
VAGQPHARRPSRARAFGLAALVLVAVAGLDQATKALAVATLVPGESTNVFFALDLSLSRNTGIAFGALAGAGDTTIVALVAVAVAALLAYFVARATRPLLWLPVGMVLGGAAGNLIDRARIGAVLDFIDPTFWPAFNLADAAIVLGVLGVLYEAEGAPPERAAASEGPAPVPTCAQASAPSGPSGPGGDSAAWHDSS